MFRPWSLWSLPYWCTRIIRRRTTTTLTTKYVSLTGEIQNFTLEIETIPLVYLALAGIKLTKLFNSMRWNDFKVFINSHFTTFWNFLSFKDQLLSHVIFRNNLLFLFQIQFTQRVHSVVEKFPRSWVYVDAGNAMYLQWQVNLDHIITVMKQMPQSIRGFSINVGSFVNASFNEQLASEIHCQTGMHFIIDTSRNGGEFSSRCA